MEWEWGVREGCTHDEAAGAMAVDLISNVNGPASILCDAGCALVVGVEVPDGVVILGVLLQLVGG